MSPTSGGFFNRGAAREEADIAGQSSFLFPSWSFIFLGFCGYMFQLWEAKGGGVWRSLEQNLLHFTHIFQDLGRTDKEMTASQVGAEAQPNLAPTEAQDTSNSMRCSRRLLCRKQEETDYAPFPVPNKHFGTSSPSLHPCRSELRQRRTIIQLEMPAF